MSQTSVSLSLPSAETVVDLARWRAEHHPAKIAYTFLIDGEAKEAHVTYAELDQQARAIAVQLQAMIAPGERALLLYPSGLDFIAGFLGCLYAGVIAVPAYPPHGRRPTPRLNAIACDAQPKLALTTQELALRVESQFAESADLTDIMVLPTENIQPNLATAWRAPELSRDSLAFLQYTSGSTGQAKGVMITHDNILHNQRMMVEAFQHNPEIIGVSWLPLFHDMGLIGNVLQPLYIGFRAVLMSPIDFLQKPIRWLRAISRYRATVTSASSFGYQLCTYTIKPEDCQDLDLSSLEIAIIGAEPIRAEMLQRFCERFGVYGFQRQAFYPCYGLAEATVFVAGGQRTQPPVLLNVDKTELETNHIARPLSEDGLILVGCGQSWAGQEIVIVQPETRQRCPDGIIGEVWVSGASVAVGYWRKSAATVETFQAYINAPLNSGQGPFLRTGDLGFVLNGELFVTGRIKDLIIIRGRNHYPQDIEHTVEQCHPALQPGGGAVFSIDVDGEERLVIVHEIRRTHRRNLNVLEVLGNIRQALAQEHQLQSFATVLIEPGTIPKTSSGKIQRRTCRDAFLTNSLSVIDNAKPDVALSAPEAPQAGKASPQPRQGVRHLNFLAEAVLDPTIHISVDSSPQAPRGRENAVFLTGATGFLGVHLLHELLQTTQADVYCLVRASDRQTGMDRLRRKLLDNRLWQERFAARIIPVLGDLTQPFFGLEPLHFQQLAEAIDVIYHNGAVVNFIQPYQTLKPANVDGVQTIIRLASKAAPLGMLKPIHYVSTVFVFGARKHFDGRTIDEANTLDDAEPLLGYFQSKWVAERLLAQASERGLPVNIYRPGLIIGNSRTGVWDNTDDFLCRLVKGCVQLGSGPDLDAELFLTPVDYVSQALVRLAQQPVPPGQALQTFHLVNSQAIYLPQLLDWIDSFGFPIQRLPLKEWQNRLMARTKDPQDNALLGLTPILAKKLSALELVTLPEMFARGKAPRFAARHTQARLGDDAAVYPPIDELLFRRFLTYFAEVDFLELPAEHHRQRMGAKDGS